MANPSNEPNNRPMLPVAQSIYDVFSRPDTSSIPGNGPEVGTRLELDDRVFYFGYQTGNASPSAGFLVSAASWVDSHQSGILLMASTNAGAFLLSATSSAAVTVNQYAEGYFGISTSSGQGYMYRIRSNAAGSTGFAITLYDSLQTPIVSGAGFFLIPNLYKDTIQGSRTLGIPIGVVCGTSVDGNGNVIAGGGTWLQTFGPCNVRHSGATPAGVALTLATGRVGAMLVSSTAVDNSMFQIGKNSPLAATASQANPVWLNIRY